jgi:hypothetical protein
MNLIFTAQKEYFYTKRNDNFQMIAKKGIFVIDRVFQVQIWEGIDIE